MLKKIKARLTKADLSKPAIDVTKAAEEQGAYSTGAGATLYPVNQDLAQAMKQSASASTNDDWKTKGDPNAPALKELMARELFEKQQAAIAAGMAVAPAQESVMNPSLAPVQEAPMFEPDVQSSSTSTQQLDDTASTAAQTTAEDLPDPLAAAETPLNDEPTVEREAGVLRISHDDEEPSFISADGTYMPHKRVETTIPAQKTIIGNPDDPAAFEQGAAVSIPHDNSSSLPMGQPATDKGKTKVFSMDGS